jgi:acetoin utilization deacetylase AcuC-like enzyme
MPESWSNNVPPQGNSESPTVAGYVFDPVYLDHDTGTHVENKRRLESIMTGLDWKGIRQLLTAIPARPASRDEVALVHRPDYIDRIEEYCRRGGGWWDADTFMSRGSYNAALYAAGGTTAAVEAVVKGKVRRAYALVRPPGHHATAGQAMGFCLFNNIAIAAAYALKSLSTKRICIIDFDVHHGNGTQEAFVHNPYVLYISTHQYPLFPGTGRIDETGRGTAEGTAINIPMPAGCGDKEYMAVFEEIVVPAARRFGPELILASAGYDGHWADEMSHMRLSVNGYHAITGIIDTLADELCGGRTVFCLEGGYNLQVLSAAVNNTFNAWLGDDTFEDPLGPPPNPIKPSDITGLLSDLKKRHGFY